VGFVNILFRAHFCCETKNPSVTDLSTRKPGVVIGNDIILTFFAIDPRSFIEPGTTSPVTLVNEVVGASIIYVASGVFWYIYLLSFFTEIIC